VDLGAGPDFEGAVNSGYLEPVTETNSVATEGVDVLVVGGGQAGLAMGYCLAERGLSFLITDANPEVGHMWRSRWQSLKLFTAAQYNDLPGMGFPAEPDTYPGKDEVADFLAAYAAKFELPVRLNTTVTRLGRGEDGRYLAETTTGPIEAGQVVIATGPFQAPFTPDMANRLDPELPQIHSAAYYRPEDLPEGLILVVGAANSGQQIALELAATRQVEIAVGQKLPTLPQRPLGRDIWWWLVATRLAKVPVSSRLGQRLSQRDVVIGGGLRELRANGVVVRPRVTAADGRTIVFDDGESAVYDGLVWATGFRTDHSWIDVPAIKNDRGQLRHDRGVTDSPGLYLLGTTWQHTRTSALLGWVGIDAAYLADEIETVRKRQIAAAREPATTS
jgi:putative flavoprotein involved in K+ transport